ncbi:hypothetical protein PR202_ga28419 [Eleusine coracana subsp. coracana]|uniref:MATH domain-containing protein n=1 Tax=Eleusine coracana subsp. coracana TaxID=191504 RepID=A0AAV5DHB0_ELECO|nr:hypothetical protein QOZ80_7AG0554950 [Eleusine coracana subsp. coracana]GJN10333.1 hypothetical protein PR202_ga28419 [Eleusine coracana subsp. coracana]
MLTMDVLSYSEAKKNLSNGNYITFDVVVAGNHSWHISFYPNGRCPTTDGIAFISVQLDDATDDDVHVVFNFMQLEVGGSGLPIFVSPTSNPAFQRRKTKMIMLNLTCFVSRKEMDKSVLGKQDHFTIRCVLVVRSPLSPSTASKPTVGIGALPPSPLLMVPSVSTAELPPNLYKIHEGLGRLLVTNEGAGMEFEVGGQLFAA